MSTTLAALIRERGTQPASSGKTFLRFFAWQCTFAEYYSECVAWANMLLDCGQRTPGKPFHVGILLDNTPDYLFGLGGTWLAGGVAVGINNTKRGSHLAQDIAFTDCCCLITEPQYLPLLESVADQTGLPAEHWMVSRRWEGMGRATWTAGEKELHSGTDVETLLQRFRGKSDPAVSVAPSDLALLVFTSGTVTAPKAVCCSHARLMDTAENLSRNIYRLGPGDAGYIAMPLFHANAVMCGFLPALVAAVPVGLARKFSKQHWLEDVRRYQATYFNYTGKPLAYILSTPRQPNDHENPLRICFGNEGSHQVVREFEERFGCQVIDVFGASEGGLGVTREPTDPPGSVGYPAPGILVVDEHGRECPPARFDAQGRVLNASECIGEIVNTLGVGWFEGYYKNDEATRERTRFGWYWSGDLGYKDERGYLYFAGRKNEWLRVDGENFLARPVEEILLRHPDVALAAVYGVPDPDGGDQVMAALVLRANRQFEPEGFASFLAAQADLSPKWVPKFVRIAHELPQTASGKVLKNELRRQKFLLHLTSDALYWRRGRELRFVPLTPADVETLLTAFARTGRQHLLEL